MDRRPQPEPTTPPSTLRAPSFEGRPLANPAEDIYDQGLAFDVETLLDRRRMLKLMGLTGLSAGLVCWPAAPRRRARRRPVRRRRPPRPLPPRPRPLPAPPRPIARSSPRRRRDRSPATVRTAPTCSARAASCAPTSARASVRTRGRRPGVPLTIKLAIQDLANGCAPLAKAAVYVWHCDRDGNYSLYSQAAAEPELSSRRAGGRRRRDRHLPEHLPGLLFGPLAAHPFRGLSEPGRRDRRCEQDRDVADRAAQGHLRRGVRDGWLRPERRATCSRSA